MHIKHHAKWIRRGIVESLEIIAWDDRDDTVLSTDKIGSSVLMDGHSG